MSKTIYVYDDEGILASAQSHDFDNDQECAINVVESLIEWSEGEGEEVYRPSELDQHVTELNEVIDNIKAGEYDLDDEAWYETELGFTFTTSLN